jgi:hypothetical protein
MIDQLKKIWKDSVFSKVIAEIIKWFWIAWFLPVVTAVFSIVKAFFTQTDFGIIWNESFDFFASLFNQTVNINLLTLSSSILGYFLITIGFRYFISNRTVNRIKKYNSDKFWNAIIKWKWRKEKGELKIKYEDYELICPICSHNLLHDQQNGHHFLKCFNCPFRSGIFHYEPPSGVVIIGVSMTDYYFHTALTSKVDAQLRLRGLK